MGHEGGVQYCAIWSLIGSLLWLLVPMCVIVLDEVPGLGVRDWRQGERGYEGRKWLEGVRGELDGESFGIRELEQQGVASPTRDLERGASVGCCARGVYCLGRMQYELDGRMTRGWIEGEGSACWWMSIDVRHEGYARAA